MSKKWEALNIPLHPEVTTAISSLNFPTMTPVQTFTIPQLLNKKDVAAEAVTGSGKTLAFLVPLVQILKQRESQERWTKHQIGAVILSPTRELALQTKTVLEQLLRHVSNLTRILFVGGSPVEDDVRSFKANGGNIVICTPGRFEDLLTRRGGELNLTAYLKSLEIMILDEADRLLDLGFQQSIDVILSHIPKQRRTGLFSATQTEAVEDLIRAGLRNPVLVKVTEKVAQSTPDLLKNYYILTKPDGKLATLITFIETHRIRKAMLFLPTCATVDYWHGIFKHIAPSDVPVMSIHGKMKEKRGKILETFRTSTRALLLCTDVMARGIDVPEVEWVLQWDPPANASAFVHRVGRTARQGREGSALILLAENEEAYVPFIEKNQKVTLVGLDDTATDETIDRLRDTIRKLQMKDRALMEKGVRAFVSHIRAYSKHECSLLLKVKELNLGALASAYGLLQLPKMSELKNTSTSDFPELPNLDINTIPYLDKTRERARLQKLSQYKETGVWPGHKIRQVKKPTEAWSLKKQKKETKKERRMKRKQKKESAEGEAPRKKKKRQGLNDEDLEELKKDIALLKKLNKKKITDEDFDKEMGLS